MLLRNATVRGYPSSTSPPSLRYSDIHDVRHMFARQASIALNIVVAARQELPQLHPSAQERIASPDKPSQTARRRSKLAPLTQHLVRHIPPGTSQNVTNSASRLRFWDVPTGLNLEVKSFGSTLPVP